MACNIITQFKTKPGCADDLIALLKKYLSESARHAGFLETSIQQNQDDPSDIISNQYWETRKHYEDYFAWRAKEGVGAQFESLCAEPISMRFFDQVIEAKTPSKMVAYVIFIKERTRNPAEIEAYKQKAPAGLAGHPITFRITHGRTEIVEGPAFEDIMMLEFPSFEEAKAWYHNAAYQAACEHRFKGGDYRAIIVEGCT